MKRSSLRLLHSASSEQEMTLSPRRIRVCALVCACVCAWEWKNARVCMCMVQTCVSPDVLNFFLAPRLKWMRGSERSEHVNTHVTNRCFEKKLFYERYNFETHPEFETIPSAKRFYRLQIPLFFQRLHSSEQEEKSGAFTGRWGNCKSQSCNYEPQSSGKERYT